MGFSKNFLIVAKISNFSETLQFKQKATPDFSISNFPTSRSFRLHFQSACILLGSCIPFLKTVYFNPSKPSSFDSIGCRHFSRRRLLVLTSFVPLHLPVLPLQTAHFLISGLFIFVDRPVLDLCTVQSNILPSTLTQDRPVGSTLEIVSIALNY